jgi:5'-3' exonuclease
MAQAMLSLRRNGSVTAAAATTKAVGGKRSLLLVDAAAACFRSHFAFANRPLRRASDGRVTSALFGFVNTVTTLIESLRPSHVVAALEPVRPLPTGYETFRHRLFAGYKAHRPPVPEELRWQLAQVQRTAQAIGVTPIHCDGFEADDVIGSLVHRARVRTGARLSLSTDSHRLTTRVLVGGYANGGIGGCAGLAVR